MTKPQFPIWVYVVVALVIAAISLAIAQFAEGMGFLFMLAATFIWMVFSISRQRKEHNNG